MWLTLFIMFVFEMTFEKISNLGMVFQLKCLPTQDSHTDTGLVCGGSCRYLSRSTSANFRNTAATRRETMSTTVRPRRSASSLQVSGTPTVVPPPPMWMSGVCAVCPASRLTLHQGASESPSEPCEHTVGKL